MLAYSVLLLTNENRVYSVQDVVAESDRDAIAAAKKDYWGVKIGRGYEIWFGDRLVHFQAFPRIKKLSWHGRNRHLANRYSAQALIQGGT